MNISWPISYILAGICFIMTIIVTLVILFGYSMSDNPQQSDMDMRGPAIGICVAGFSVSALIALSHFIHIQW